MNDRQTKILNKLKKTGHVSISEEAGVFGVNEMTIRRDLDALAEIGEVTRVHGGATLRSPMPTGVDFLTIPARPAQTQIAKETVKRLSPGTSVMLNTGTTVLQVAREIAISELSLTVITNSLAVAIALYRSECQVLLTGGTLRQKWLDLTGPITQNNLDEYYVDVLITGCDGAIPSEGFFTEDINLAEIEKKSVKIAKRVLVTTESAKFGQRSFARFAGSDEVDMVITDRGLSKADAAALSKQKIEVIQA